MLPDYISADLIREAVREFDQGRLHNFADSTKYDLVVDNRRYPPKAIIGIAAERLTGVSMRPEHFSGGRGSKCFRLLQDAGFEIQPKLGITEQEHLGPEIEDENEEEGKSPPVFFEGDTSVKTVRQYERSRAARRECLKMNKPVCIVCSFDFGAAFGPLGTGFIHVHHLQQIAESNGPREVDPSKDLVPVCPNCHAMLHHRGKLRTPEELKAILAEVTSSDHLGNK